MTRRENEPQREPNSLLELVYGRSFEELDYIARVYRRYGLVEKADEIDKLFRNNPDDASDEESAA